MGDYILEGGLTIQVTEIYRDWRILYRACFFAELSLGKLYTYVLDVSKATFAERKVLRLLDQKTKVNPVNGTGSINIISSDFNMYKLYFT